MKQQEIDALVKGIFERVSSDFAGLLSASKLAAETDRETIKALSETVSALRKEIEEGRAASAKAAQATDERVDSFLERIDALQKDLREISPAATQIVELRERVHESEEFNRGLQDEISQLERHVNHSATEISAFEAKVAELGDSVSSLTEEFKEFEADDAATFSVFGKRLDSLDELVTGVNKKVEKLEDVTTATNDNIERFVDNGSERLSAAEEAIKALQNKPEISLEAYAIADDVESFVDGRISELKMAARAEQEPISAKIESLEHEVFALKSAPGVDLTPYALAKDIGDVFDFAKGVASDLEAAKETVDSIADALALTNDEAAEIKADVSAIKSLDVAGQFEAMADRIDAVTIEAVAEVAKAVDALPKAADGRGIESVSRDGDDLTLRFTDGTDYVVKGVRGEKGEKGDEGDAVGLASAVIDRDGNLTVHNSKGMAFNLGAVVGKDGENAKGIDGKDGFTLDDFALDFDGERTVTMTLTPKTGEPIVKSFKIPALIYRGIWDEKSADTLERGDVVTWGGSTWIAKGEPKGKPDAGNGWQLAVKKGRDAKQPVKVAA